MTYKNLLYVDDDQLTDQHLIPTLLQARFPSLRIYTAGSNQEAIDLSIERPYDIVLYRTSMAAGKQYEDTCLLRALSPEGKLVGVTGYDRSGENLPPCFDHQVNMQSVIHRAPALEQILNEVGVQAVEKAKVRPRARIT